MRLIDADALKAESYKSYDSNGAPCYVVDVLDIDKAPTIETERVAHGHWIWREFHGRNESWYQCSECNAYDLRGTNVPSPYCWACGARMDGERKEDDLRTSANHYGEKRKDDAHE